MMNPLLVKLLKQHPAVDTLLDDLDSTFAIVMRCIAPSLGACAGQRVTLFLDEGYK